MHQAPTIKSPRRRRRNVLRISTPVIMATEFRALRPSRGMIARNNVRVFGSETIAGFDLMIDDRRGAHRSAVEQRIPSTL